MVSTKLKTLAKATRMSLRRRGHDWQISSALEEEIFRLADVLSEGSTRTAASGQSTYFGSTMVTVDLSRLQVRVAGAPAATARHELMRAVEGSVRMHLRVMRMARAEAARRVHRRLLGTAICEMRVGLRGEHLHIDVDLEVPLRVSSRATRPG